MTARGLARSLPFLSYLVHTALALAALGSAVWLNPPPLSAAEPIEVVAVVLAHPDVGAGREQIVQVTLRNNGASAAPVGVRLTMRDERGRPQGRPVQRAVTLNPYDEQRVLLTLRAPLAAGGYKVQIGLFSADFRKQIAANEPAFYATFTVGGVGETLATPPVVAAPPPPSESTAAVDPTLSFPAPQGLSFELADAMWENFNVFPQSFLAGDTGRVRADLRNVGGDIMRNVTVKVTYFNVRIPNRAEPIAESNVVALAPGEKIEMEWEFKFPDDALLGEYRVQLEARAAPETRESNLDNNRAVTERPIELNNIRLVFPDPNYIFDEAGLFLFRWESKLYDEFKVQVGTDPGFQEAERFFDIPQGGKWTKDLEVVPLEGELPGMARGLMERAQTDRILWRVVGRNTQSSRTGYSRVQSFTIRAEPAPDEESAPAELRPAAPRPPAGGAAPRPPESEEEMMEPEAPTPPGNPAPPGSPTPGGASAPPPAAPRTAAPASPQAGAPATPAAPAAGAPATPQTPAPRTPPPAPSAAAPAAPQAAPPAAPGQP